MSGNETSPTLSRRWNDFFHGTEVPYGLALYRIGLCVVALSSLVRRWLYAREMYSTDGVAAPMMENYQTANILPIFPGVVAVGLLTLLCVTLVAAAVGWRTRLSLLISCVLYTYFCLIDVVGTMAKFSCIITHSLLILACSRCGDVLSVDGWLRRRENPKSTPAPSPLWPRRLIQLLVGIVYFSAAITKLKAPTYFTGEQMTAWLLSDNYFRHPLGIALAMNPALTILSAYVTVLFELLFVFLCWRGWSRNAMIASGVLFHIGTYFLLGLIVFPFLFCVIYFAFYSEDDYRRLWSAMLRLRERWFPRTAVATGIEVPPAPRPLPAVPGMLVYGLIALGCVLAGLKLEERLDPYGIRRPEGRHQLAVVPPERVKEMLYDETLIRERDKFFAFDIGTSMFSGTVVDRRDRYDFGETVIANCELNPPHEDLWLQCQLRDEHNQIIKTKTSCALREHTRVAFEFPLDDQLLPGRYEFVLTCRGTEVGRRRFTLGSGSAAPVPIAPVAN